MKRAQFTPTGFDAEGIALAWDSDCPDSLAFGLSTNWVLVKVHIGACKGKN